MRSAGQASSANDVLVHDRDRSGSGTTGTSSRDLSRPPCQRPRYSTSEMGFGRTLPTVRPVSTCTSCYWPGCSGSRCSPCRRRMGSRSGSWESKQAARTVPRAWSAPLGRSYLVSGSTPPKHSPSSRHSCFRRCSSGSNRAVGTCRSCCIAGSRSRRCLRKLPRCCNSASRRRRVLLYTRAWRSRRWLRTRSPRRTRVRTQAAGTYCQCTRPNCTVTQRCTSSRWDSAVSTLAASMRPRTRRPEASRRMTSRRPPRCRRMHRRHPGTARRALLRPEPTSRGLRRRPAYRHRPMMAPHRSTGARSRLRQRDRWLRR